MADIISGSKRTAVATAVAACFPGLALGAGVARVEFALGDVVAVGASGQARALSRGSEIEPGDTVATRQGRAQLRFADGAFMSLQPQTEFKVERFHYSGREDGSENIVMNLVKGGMRTITGLIGRTRKDRYQLNTAVATIGIRGTEYSVRYTNSIEVFCALGSIAVQNEGGTLLLGSGEGARVLSVQAPPQKTEQPPVLAPQASGGNQQEEEPQNPTQDKDPPVTEQLAQQQAAKLTGTVTGNWAAIAFEGSGYTVWGPMARVEETLTLDSAGTLTSFTDNYESSGTAIPGTSVPQSSGNDGILAWGRWIGGTTAGDGPFAGAYLENDGALHYVVGLPVTNMPVSGEATYTMIGTTPPSLLGSFTSAGVNSSSIVVNFATTTAMFHLNMTVDANTVQTMPGGITLYRSGSILSGDGTLWGPYCSQSIDLQGFLAGPAAARAGMVYQINADPGKIFGAIAYKKN